MFHQFFFEFAWKLSSVLTGYNDEYSSFMPAHYLVYHLDLYLMETHKVATLSLSWF